MNSKSILVLSIYPWMENEGKVGLMWVFPSDMVCDEALVYIDGIRCRGVAPTIF